MKEDPRRGETPRRGSRREMSRKKISEMREDKQGIPLFIGWWPEHLKRHHQWKVDTWHLPQKAKSTRLVANIKMTRGISIYWHQLNTSKDVSAAYSICRTTHMDKGGTDGVKEKASSHIRTYGLSVEKPIRTR